MTILRIPVPKSVPSFTERVLLERTAYILDMHWNERQERWYFSLADSTGALIVSRAITTNWPLLHGVVSDSRPPGELVAYDAQALEVPIAFADWGDRVVLRYYEAADVAEIVGS